MFLQLCSRNISVHCFFVISYLGHLGDIYLRRCIKIVDLNSLTINFVLLLRNYYLKLSELNDEISNWKGLKYGN